MDDYGKKEGDKERGFGSYGTWIKIYPLHICMHFFWNGEEGKVKEGIA